MADLMQFETVAGYGIVVDCDMVSSFWEGQNPDEIVMVIMGQDDPVTVVGDFLKFVDEWLDVYDARPIKKKPRTKKAQGSNSTPKSNQAVIAKSLL